MQVLADPAIVVNNIVKVYRGNRISLRGRRPDTVRALDHVSLVACKSESIGVIGVNGSGKSTLLNIIAGNELSTSGEVLVSEIPTILSVGAAMKPQVTGWHNIYLGLLAKGLSAGEAKQLRPEVAEWSELGDALHRELRTYSSGMKARLTFAVSTSVYPGILLVDEALATGDATFTEKAARRMEAVLAKAGTVMVVTHSPEEIKRHCSRAIWLDQGNIIADGDVDTVTENYRRWGNYRSNGKEENASRVLREVRRSYVKPMITLATS
ncbi:teichoic acid transport system ATP-binding protein [Corynebacterium afermentans]